MNTHIPTKQYVRVFTLARPTAWIVYAVLMEGVGDSAIAVSEPKILKIIPRKAGLALSGSTRISNTAALSGIVEAALNIQTSIISPFVTLSGYNNSNSIAWVTAIPPTLV